MDAVNTSSSQDFERFLLGTECYRGVYQSLNITDHLVVARLLKLQQQNDFNNISLYATLIVLASVFITCPNVLLVVGLIRTNKVLSPIKKLFVYLSVTDSLVGLVALPLYVGLVVVGKGSCGLVSACVLIGTFSEAIGICTFLTISCLRYLQTSRPFMLINYKYVITALLLEAGLALGFALVASLDHIHQVTAYTLGLHLIIIAVALIVVTSASIVLNILSLVAHRRHKEKLSKTMKQQASLQDIHRRAIHRLMLIASVLGLCFLPVGVFYIYVGSLLTAPNPDPEGFYKELLYFSWLNILMFINAGLNATIYIYRSDKLKDYYKQVFLNIFKS